MKHFLSNFGTTLLLLAAIASGSLIGSFTPGTDWFLGFTKLAKGNTSLGSVLIPINFISQLLLFPVFLVLFAGKKIGIEFAEIASTLWQWLLLPFFAAIILHQILSRLLPTSLFAKLLRLVGTLIPLTIRRDLATGSYDQCGSGLVKPKGLADGVQVGCFPQLYAALGSNPPDQVITL